MRPEDCGKMSSILSRLSASSDVPLSDRELLADLICYGDGGFFMDRVITPIFFVMSYEIDHLSTLSVDTTHRWVGTAAKGTRFLCVSVCLKRERKRV